MHLLGTSLEHFDHRGQWCLQFLLLWLWRRPLSKRQLQCREQFRCSVQVEFLLVMSPSRNRDWSRAWPPRVARQSRLPSCASHALLVHSRSPRQNLSRLLSPLDPLLLQLLFQRILALWSPRPTPMTNGDALLDAHGLAGTAATVAQQATAAGASRLCSRQASPTSAQGS